MVGIVFQDIAIFTLVRAGWGFVLKSITLGFFNNSRWCFRYDVSVKNFRRILDSSKVDFIRRLKCFDFFLFFFLLESKIEDVVISLVR